MSLINDALKRTKEFQQRQPQAPPVPPHESHATAVKPKAGPGWAIPVLIALLIAAWMLIVLERFLTKPTAHVVTTATIPIRQPVRVVTPVPRPTPPPAPATNQIVALAAPAPPPRPVLRVQGISYSNAKWEAIVNGTTVYVGDTVNGFRIAVISRNNVLFITPGGSQKTLALGE